MSLSDQQVQQYLERIGLEESLLMGNSDYDRLVLLQQAHLSNVPFENLDIIDGHLPLSLDIEDLFDKIVTRRRGGICYELNLLFAELLKSCGFEIRYRSAMHPKYGDEFDHAFLEVILDDGRHMLADAGLLLNPHAPLELVVGEVQSDGWSSYRFDAAPDLGKKRLRLVQVKDNHDSELFSFGPRACEPRDYRQRCDWYSSAEQSRFTQGLLAAIDTQESRAMLSLNRFTWSENGQVRARDLADGEVAGVLGEVFKLSR